MKAFEYAGPATTGDAVKALAAADSAALSGGTDLINRMKDYVTAPKRVVNLKGIKDLSGIAWDPNVGLTIGAGTRLVDIVNHQGIGEHLPALKSAAYEIGTPQIRNMATLGGNLLQRPRCWYFRAGYGLLGGKKEGKSLIRTLEGEYAPIEVTEGGEKSHLVRAGDNRYGAIFMTDGDALYVNPSSLATPLIALGAKATLVGPKGERTIPVQELYQVPKKEGDLELTIAPGELLTKVVIPPGAGKNASYEVRQKQAHDWPLAQCSVVLTMDGDNVKESRVVLNAVAPIPLRCEPAEKAINGKPITVETAEAAAAAAVASAKPLSMNGYKVALTKTAVKRALLAAAGNRYWEA